MARLRPSGSHEWMHCAGSVQMQEMFPQMEDPQSAMDGTAAHWVASECLEDYPKASGVKLAFDFIGKPAPNGVIIDESMADGADVYINSVLKTCQKRGLLQQIQVEKFVNIDRIHPTECGGTPDCYVWDANAGILDVWDLKYGHGVIEVFENPQLILYAVGILDQITGGNAMVDEFTRVNLHIIQPRAYHPDGVDRTWSIKAIDLRAIVNVLTGQASAALVAQPPTKSGDHCRYCTAITHCQTAQRASANAIDHTDKMTIEVIPPDQLALHREILNRSLSAIKHRLTGVDSEIEALIKNGVNIDGLSLDNPPGRLKWIKPDAEIIALAELMGADLTKVVCCTPTQAKKMLDPSLIDAYAKPSTGKTKIVNSKTTRAAKVFGAQTKKVN